MPVRANYVGRGAKNETMVGLTEHMQLTLGQLRGLGALILPPHTIENLRILTPPKFNL